MRENRETLNYLLGGRVEDEWRAEIAETVSANDNEISQRLRTQAERTRRAFSTEPATEVAPRKTPVTVAKRSRWIIATASAACLLIGFGLAFLFVPPGPGPTEIALTVEPTLRTQMAGNDTDLLQRDALGRYIVPPDKPFSVALRANRSGFAAVLIDSKTSPSLFPLADEPAIQVTADAAMPFQYGPVTVAERPARVLVIIADRNPRTLIAELRTGRSSSPRTLDEWRTALKQLANDGRLKWFSVTEFRIAPSSESHSSGSKTRRSP